MLIIMLFYLFLKIFYKKNFNLNKVILILILVQLIFKLLKTTNILIPLNKYFYI